MGQWLPDAVEDPYNKYIAGPADHAAGSVDESIGRQFDDEPGHGFADQIADAPGLQDNLNDGRDDFVITGTPKKIVDTVFDYKPIKNPETGETVYTDEEDLLGPSVDLDPREDESVIDWRSEKSREEDPTSPENSWLVRWLMNNPEKAILAVIALYVLTALGPILELAANATE